MDHRDKGLTYKPRESNPCQDEDQKHQEIVGIVEDLGIGERIADTNWVYALDVEVRDISLEIVLNNKGQDKEILHRGRDLVGKTYQTVTEIDQLVVTSKENNKGSGHQNKNSF